MLALGPLQGICSQSSLLTDSQLGFLASHLRGFDQHKLSQLHQQALSEAQLASTQPIMDDFPEQSIPLPWSEMGCVNKAPWVATSMIHSVMPNTGLPCQNSDLQDCTSQPQNNMVQYPFEDALNAIRLPQQCLQEALVGTADMPARFRAIPPSNGALDVPHLRRNSQGMSTAGSVRMPLNSGKYMIANSSSSQGSAMVSSAAPGLTISPSTGSNGMVGSACQLSSPKSSSNPKAGAWHEPYLNGVLPHPLGVADAKSKSFPTQEGTAVDADFLKKRSRDDADDVNKQGGQGFLMPSYGSVAPQGAGAAVSGTARPRVRARRGQATDPHSIAERLRRERIAERMKALQELVPNANKTDKASMLDEIIEYVRFLQLQVKVLSMSRLGGAGAVASLVTDLPLEGQNNYFTGAALYQNAGSSGSLQDGMAVAEHQVARLMDEDMGSAMQFLQSKGLCLMPVSLANFISSTDSTFGGGVQPTAVDQSQRDTLSFTTVEGCRSTLTSSMILPPPSGSIGAED